MAFNNFFNSWATTPQDAESKLSIAEKKIKAYEDKFNDINSKLEIARQDVLEKSELINNLKVDNLKLQKKIKKNEQANASVWTIIFIVMILFTFVSSLIIATHQFIVCT